MFDEDKMNMLEWPGNSPDLNHNEMNGLFLCNNLMGINTTM